MVERLSETYVKNHHELLGNLDHVQNINFRWRKRDTSAVFLAMALSSEENHFCSGLLAMGVGKFGFSE